MKPIWEVSKKIGLELEDLELYGKYMAKVSWEKVSEMLGEKRRGKLVLVTGITPTRFGEGKTTTTIGLAGALSEIGFSSTLSIREPSLGPVFGIKGGATGGGKSRVVPSEEINLHFTGDFHAITSAHNLLSAIINNHIFQGNELEIKEVTWPRTLDMNDRSLRKVIVGLDRNGHLLEDKFVITAASEIMTILSLSRSYSELKERIAEIIVGFNSDGEEVRVRDLHVEGAITALLKNALKPNLVQTTDGIPAFVHTGAFANISHGTSSLISMELGLRLSDYVVVESGFGSDLGAEKFVNIVSRISKFDNICCAVIVSSIRALKEQGNGDLARGLSNLEEHVRIVRELGLEPVVSLNVFDSDTESDIRTFFGKCEDLGVDYSETHFYSKGSKGGTSLAEIVAEKRGRKPKYTYSLDENLKEKIEKVSRLYGGSGSTYSKTAEDRIKKIGNRLNYPICIAKTQFSLSDDPNLKGAPKDFEIRIRDIWVYGGAKLLVPIAGDILLMPGLPKRPNAERVDIDEHGEIRGILG